MTQMSASRTSRIWFPVRVRMPMKIDTCCVIKSVANVTPKTSPRYLLRSPVSIRNAIQVMAAPSSEFAKNGDCLRPSDKYQGSFAGWPAPVPIFHKLSPNPTRDDQRFARDPRRIVGGQKDGGRSDVLCSADPAQRRLRLRVPLEVAADDPRAMGPFRLDHAGIDRIDANLARSQLLGERPRDGINRRLGGAIDCAGRRRESADDRADIDDAAAAGAEVLHRLLGGQDQTEHVQVEL